MKYILLSTFLLLALTGFAQRRYSSTSRFTSYKGLLMAGYQGWFNAPGDGAGRGWYHYRSRGEFGPGNTKIDMWPETNELIKKYKTPFILADGSPAYLPSSYDSSTIDTHFRWMKDYGIDGVFMQRFVVEIKNPSGRNHFNKVLGSALQSSRKFRRAIAVMYDFSGMTDEDTTTFFRDWKYLVDSMKIAAGGNRQTYLYHAGKPLVVLWGVGFNDNRKYSLTSVNRIIEFLKNDPLYGNCSIMLGVPTYWREFGNDTGKDAYLHELIKKCDIVHPWTVGRFTNADGYSKYAEVQRADLAWCRKNHIDYVHVAFPGFSWHNMNPRSPSDQIPRDRGRFLWRQLSTAIKDGADMIYIAMFDEVDEATAIFKISKSPPVGESRFIAPEPDIPSDYYLYLAGYAAKMLRKQIPFQDSIPPPKAYR